jgi:hypothetical protein
VKKATSPPIKTKAKIPTPKRDIFSPPKMLMIFLPWLTGSLAGQIDKVDILLGILTFKFNFNSRPEL